MGEGGPLVVLILWEEGEGSEEARDEEEQDEVPVSEAVEGRKGANSSVEGVVGTDGVGVGVGAGRAFERGGGAGGASGLVEVRGEVGVERDGGERPCLVGGEKEGRKVNFRERGFRA